MAEFSPRMLNIYIFYYLKCLFSTNIHNLLQAEKCSWQSLGVRNHQYGCQLSPQWVSQLSPVSGVKALTSLGDTAVTTAWVSAVTSLTKLSPVWGVKVNPVQYHKLSQQSGASKLCLKTVTTVWGLSKLWQQSEGCQSWHNSLRGVKAVNSLRGVKAVMTVWGMSKLSWQSEGCQSCHNSLRGIKAVMTVWGVSKLSRQSEGCPSCHDSLRGVQAVTSL